MTRPTACTTPLVALALCSLLWLSSLAPVLAATVTDTFPLTLTGTERCRDDSKFVETVKWKILDGKTLTLKRDVLNTGDLTDIQATINTHGDNATIDVITLNGRAFLANTLGSTAKLVLSGRDPGHPDRFFTLRGTATFNQAGKLTKATGTFIFQILDEVHGVQDVDCVGSGTFATGKNRATLNFSDCCFYSLHAPELLLLPVSRGGDTTGTTSVDYLISGQDAVEGIEYQLPPAPRTVIFNPGETQKNIPIQLLGSARVPCKNLELTLANPSAGSSVIKDSSIAIITIYAANTTGCS